MERERIAEMMRLRSQLGVSAPQRAETPPLATVDVNVVTNADGKRDTYFIHLRLVLRLTSQIAYLISHVHEMTQMVYSIL